MSEAESEHLRRRGRYASHAVPHLEAWRARRGWTIAQLAQAAHVGEATISRAEQGELVTSRILHKLAAGLGISAERLRTDDPSQLAPGKDD